MGGRRGAVSRGGACGQKDCLWSVICTCHTRKLGTCCGSPSSVCPHAYLPFSPAALSQPVPGWVRPVPCPGFLSTSGAVWSPPCTVSCPGTLPCPGQQLSWPWGVLHPLFTPFLACQQNSCLVGFWEISREMMGAVCGAWMPRPCRP